MSKKTDKDSFDFESALEELESLVEKLEKGDLPLEESLKEFERGITLTRNCQKELKEAEHKVRILTEEGTEKDFGEDDLV
jgi:exodeoxyribonuclease VII small subunit